MEFRSEDVRDILADSSEIGNPGGNSRRPGEIITSTPNRDDATFVDPTSTRRRVTIEDTPTESETKQDHAMEAIAQLIQHFTSQVTKMNHQRARPSRTFSGQIYENPAAFVRYMDDFFEENSIEEDHIRGDVFRGQLRDAAKKWAQPLEGVPMTYRAFRDSFLRQYNSNAVKNEAMSQLYGEKQKPSESVDVFLNRKRSLFARINPGMGETAMTEVLKDQLLPPLKSRLRNVEFTDLSELINQAGRVEADVREEAEYYEKVNSAPQRATPRSLTNIGTSNSGGGQTLKGNNRTNRPPSPCRFCQQWHYNYECPHNPYKNLNTARVPEERGRSTTETRSNGVPRSAPTSEVNRPPTLRSNQVRVVTEVHREAGAATEQN